MPKPKRPFPAPARLRLAVVVSDLHVGSTVGLCPPEYETLEGVRVGINPFQAWLWDLWQDAWGAWLPSVTGGDPYALIVNGDAVDGVHHRTTQVWSSDPADHVGAAVAALRAPAQGAAAVYVTLGTESHTASREHALARSFGAVESGEGRAAWDRLDADLCGVRCVFRHHIGTTSRPYLEATQLSIHLAAEQLEAVKTGDAPPRVLVCAHRHVPGEWSNGHGLTLVTGAWQGATRYVHKVVPQATPRPSVAVLDWRGLPDGALPRVHHRVYQPKPRKTIVL